MRVLLIERGSALNTWASGVPAISSNYVTPGSPAYRFDSAPLEHCGGRILELAGGKALGGTSRINGLMYTRGSAADFNRWRESGRQGWGYDDVEPFFIKSEGFHGQAAPEHHGVKGESMPAMHVVLFFTAYLIRTVEDAWVGQYLPTFHLRVRLLYACCDTDLIKCWLGWWRPLNPWESRWWMTSTHPTLPP